jgi:hypothetical protein
MSKESEQTQETLAVLKILAIGNQCIKQGKVKPLAEVIEKLKKSKRLLRT